MANKDLKDSFFTCSDEVINKLKSALSRYGDNTGSGGYKRAKGIIDNRKISYPQIKKIKNYFDNYDGDGFDKEYLLNGGDTMKQWVNNTLGNTRDTIHDTKKVEMNGGKENSFIKTHTKDKDNADPTNVHLPKPNKGSQYDNIMNNRTVYECLEQELNKSRYLINYMDNNKKII